MKKIVLIGLFFMATTQLLAQAFDVPANYKLEAKEDYAQYEDDVINGVDWLMNTPLSEEAAKRQDVKAFLMKWMMGSPNVSIGLSQDIVTFMDSPDCLIIFLGGWAKYALETKDFKNNVQGNMAGIESVITFYEKNKVTIGKNKAIEKYIKLKEKNKLEDFIKSKV